MTKYIPRAKVFPADSLGPHVVSSSLFITYIMRFGSDIRSARVPTAQYSRLLSLRSIQAPSVKSSSLDIGSASPTSPRRYTMPATTISQHVLACAEAQDLPISQTPEKSSNGDLNNTASMRAVIRPQRHTEFAYRSLSIPPSLDDPALRSRYRPFLLPNNVTEHDWISRLELATVTGMAYNDLKLTRERIKVLVLYGSLRSR